MDYRYLSKEIVKRLGGEKNIAALTHCATRLRFTLRDDSIIDAKAIENLEGVAGTSNRAGQFQVIIGPEVSSLYSVLINECGLDFGDDTPNAAGKSLLNTVMDTIAGIFTPVLMPIMAAGMIKALLSVLLLLQLVSKTDEIYTVLTFISDSAFYFLPLLLGFSAGKKFGCSPYLGAMLGGVLIHPTFSAMVSEGNPVHFFGMEIPLVSYGSSVIPIVLAVWFMSYVQKLATKIVPSVLKVLGIPLLTILISAPIMLLAIAPLGNYAGGLLTGAVDFLNGFVPWLVPVLFGAFNPLLVMMGMHYAFMPVSTMQMATMGKEYLMGGPSLASNMAQAAATLCVAMKSKDHTMRQTAASTGFTALMGITEPALFGVTLKLKRPLYCAMVGGAMGGLYAGMTGVYRVAFGATGLATLGVFVSDEPMNFVNAVIAGAIALVTSFALTWFFGFSPANSRKSGDDGSKEGAISDAGAATDTEIMRRPLEGEIVPLSEVPDPAFSSGALGQGVAIKPTCGTLRAPADGVIQAVFPTGHAIGMVTSKGTEILMHIGIDTVRLEGTGFEVKVRDKQHVKCGDPLVVFDADVITQNGYDTITPIVVTNLGKSDQLKAAEDSNDRIFTIERGSR